MSIKAMRATGHAAAGAACGAAAPPAAPPAAGAPFCAIALTPTKQTHAATAKQFQIRTAGTPLLLMRVSCCMHYPCIFYFYLNDRMSVALKAWQHSREFQDRFTA
jgi:hypothetical protein